MKVPLKLIYCLINDIYSLLKNSINQEFINTKYTTIKQTDFESILDSSYFCTEVKEKLKKFYFCFIGKSIKEFDITNNNLIECKRFVLKTLSKLNLKDLNEYRKKVQNNSIKDVIIENEIPANKIEIQKIYLNLKNIDKYNLSAYNNSNLINRNQELELNNDQPELNNQNFDINHLNNNLEINHFVNLSHMIIKYEGEDCLKRFVYPIIIDSILKCTACYLSEDTLCLLKIAYKHIQNSLLPDTCMSLILNDCN
jgi:hypothetical protein